MRTRSLSLWAALVLLVSLSGAWAQSGDAAPALPKGIDPALLAKAKAGDADAAFRLSLRYSDLGNQKESCRWARIAAEDGNAVEQVALASFYEFGSNLCAVARDYTQAAYWYRKAAEQGEAGAQFALGNLYQDGHGVPQDYAQATIWWRKAANQGIAEAQYNVGMQYALGQGVPQDYVEAYFWLDLSAAGNVVGISPSHAAKLREEAAKSRDLAASFLTSADLLRAQERARKWFEDHPAKP